MKVQFCGAARTVTGSKHLITTPGGKKLLLDCGLFQGASSSTGNYNQDFPFEPGQIDAMVLSHAHIDHAGNIPRLVKLGYGGPIYCTPATADLCTIMLADSAHIQEADTRYINEKRKAKDLPPIEPLYSKADVEAALQQFQTADYGTPFSPLPGVTAQFTDAGHILGSAALHLTFQTNTREVRLVFTGDIGRPNDRILRDPQPFAQADYIICESTYGNRTHEPRWDSDQKLLDIIVRTCVEKKGKLVIPAFSLGRTQELVYTMDRLNTEGKLPPVKVFVDSPLSINATEVMRRHPECFNPDIRDYMQHDPDPFGFGKLTYVNDVAESKRLNALQEPCIVISASGMAEAGRIKHHLKSTISDERNSILLVGYATPESLGGAIKAGKNPVRIFGDYYTVNAEVFTLDAFSAHADFNEMLDFLACQDKAQVKRIFLVHGEYNVQKAWRETLRIAGFKDVYIPDMEETIELE